MGKPSDRVTMSDASAKKYFNLAVQAEAEGNLESAADIYKQALAEDPKFIQAWLNLGSLEFRLVRKKDSIHSLEQALSLNPELLQAHLLLAQIYREENQEDQTGKYLQSAYRIDPKNKFALGALAVFYYEKGLFAESLKMVDQYLNFYPDDKNLRILRTDILAKQGNYKESLNELTDLVKKDAGFANFQSNVKKSLSGDDPEMKEHVENLARRTKAKIHEFKAKLELSQENPEDFSPPDPQDAMDLSLLYLFQGESEKAMKYLVYAKKTNEESRKNELGNRNEVED